MTDDLVSWLRACLDADEQEIAKHEEDYAPCVGPLGIESSMESNYPCSPILLIAKSRALAEVQAKRAILDRVVDEATGLDMQVDDEWRVEPRDTATEPYLGEVLLRLLALPCSDRPGYREEWRP